VGITGQPFPYPSAKDRDCFYCYRPLDDPAVMWIGDGEIYLHPHCVVDLTLRLFRDVHEIQTRQSREWYEGFSR